MRFLLCLTIISSAALGCNRAAEAPKVGMLPVKGKVTLDGKPLSGAQVVFLGGSPPVIFAGTTDDQGAYQLQGRESGLQGACKVTISQMLKPDGAPLSPGEMPAMVGAVEQLPAKYSQFDVTELNETVGPEGGNFDFALQSK